MRAHWRGWSIVLVLAIAIALIGGRLIGGTFASSFNGSNTYAGSTFSAGSLTAPSAMTATPSGNSVSLAWTHGANGNDQSLGGVDNTTSSTCTSSDTFTTISSTIAQTTSTYTDTNRATQSGVAAGDWYCYQMETIYGTSWSSSGTYATAQVGYVADALVLPKSGGSIGTGDSIASGATVKVTFNQAPGTNPSTTYHVCTFASPTNEILLGDSTATGTSNNCATTDTYTFGKLLLTGTGVSLTHSEKYNITSYSTTTDTVTLTIGALSTGSTDTTVSVPSGDTPTWTFTPATSLTSSTGTVAACATNTHANSLCDPATNTSF